MPINHTNNHNTSLHDVSCDICHIDGPCATELDAAVRAAIADDWAVILLWGEAVCPVCLSERMERLTAGSRIDEDGDVDGAAWEWVDGVEISKLESTFEPVDVAGTGLQCDDIYESNMPRTPSTPATPQSLVTQQYQYSSHDILKN